MKETKMTSEPVLDGIHIHLENRKLSRICFVYLFVLYSLVVMTKNCFGSAMTAIVSEGIMTKSQTGFISSLFYIIYTPLQIIGGMWADKYNPERLIKYGLIGSAVINLIVYFNQNYYFVLCLWSLNAIFQAPIWCSVFKIMSSQLVRSDRKTMGFYISFSGSLGLLISFLIAALVKRWQQNFIISFVILGTLALTIHFGYKHVEHFMKPDKEEIKEEKSKAEFQLSSLKFFFLSGLIMMFVVSMLRNSLDQGIKTLSSVMLFESYEAVSPVIGNLIGTFINITGVVGTLIGAAYIKKKKEEKALKGHGLFLIYALPFFFLITFIGKINIVLTVSAIFVALTLTSATGILNTYYSMSFTKIGKNGVAAGMSNAGAALGIVLYNSFYTRVAELYNWQMVAYLFVAVSLIAAIFSFISYYVHKKFIKKYDN